MCNNIQEFLKLIHDDNLESFNEAAALYPGLINTPGEWRYAGFNRAIPNVHPLHVAARYGKSSILKRILDFGVDVNSRDGFNYSPLALASWGGHTECANLLLSKENINLNCANRDGMTALHEACRHNRNDIALALLRRGVTNAAQKTSNDETPIMLACLCGDDAIDVVEQLIGCGADANDYDIEFKGLNLTDAALKRGHLKLSALLSMRTEKNTDVDVGPVNLNNSTKSAFFKAVSGGNSYEVETAIHRNPEIATTSHVWVHNGSSSTARPIAVAIQCGQANILRLLLQNDSVRNEINSLASQFSPLMLATKKNELKCARELLSHPDIDVNLKSVDEGLTALHIACQKGHPQLANLLLAKGADPNAQDSDGGNPLFWATRNGFLDLVKLLLSRGSDPNMKDRFGDDCSAVAKAAPDLINIYNELESFKANGYKAINIPSTSEDVPIFIEDQLQAEVTVTLGETVLLTCTTNVCCTPPVWLKDHAPISKQYIKTKSQGKCHRLKIPNSSVRHSGTYTVLFTDEETNTMVTSCAEVFVTMPSMHQIMSDNIELTSAVLGAGTRNTVKGIYHQRDVAVKVIHEKSRLSPNISCKILHEAKNMLDIQNKDVVTCFGVLEDHVNFIYGIVMDYMPNKSLEFCIDKYLLENSIKCEIIVAVARGMSFLHNKKMVHRDLKSSNVLLDEMFFAKISDFGQSKFDNATSSVTKSSASEFIGTFTHMAPEVIWPVNGQFCSPSDDVWSFGIMLFELFAENKRYSAENFARQPFNEDQTIPQILCMVGVLKQCPITEEQIHSKIPRDCLVVFIDLMKRCCQPDYVQRPNFANIYHELDTVMRTVYHRQVHCDRLNLCLDKEFIVDGMCSGITDLKDKITEVCSDTRKEDFLSDIHCIRLAEAVGDEGELDHLRICLDLKDSDVCGFIDNEHSFDRALRMFITWRQRNGNLDYDELFEKFLKSCDRAERMDLIRGTRAILLDKDLLKLAKHMGCYWTKICKELNFTQQEIDEIQINSTDHHLAAFRMLVKWMRKSSDVYAAVVKLQQVVENIGQAYDGENHKNWFQDVVSSRLNGYIPPIYKYQANSQTTVPEVLKHHFTYLLCNIDATKLLLALIEQEVIEDKEKLLVLMEPTKRAQNRTLLRLLSTKKLGVQNLNKALEQMSETEIQSKLMSNS